MNATLAETIWAVPAVALAAALGVVIGSFLNVVISRVPAGESLLTPSHCPTCGAPIHWRDNVPVISWLSLRGTSRCCHTHISAQYPLVEASTALAWVAITAWFLLRWPASPARFVETIVYLYFASISIALGVIDARWHRLPDAIVLPGYIVIGVGLGLSAVLAGNWAQLGQAAVGMIVGGGLYLLLRLIRPDGMGAGDVKLAGLIGFALGWLGWSELIVGIFAGFLFGGLWGVGVIIARKGGRKTAIPFGPFMLIGAWVAVFASRIVIAAYLGLFGLS